MWRKHTCQEMNELDLERCCYIPDNAHGADWRMLQDTVIAHPECTLYKMLATS